jgi:hypothetical protein
MKPNLAGIGMEIDFGWDQTADSTRAIVAVDNHGAGEVRTGTVAARADIHTASALDEVDTIGLRDSGHAVAARADIHIASALDEIDMIGRLDSGYTVGIALWQEQLSSGNFRPVEYGRSYLQLHFGHCEAY